MPSSSPAPRRLQGVVVSTANVNTAVVRVERQISHPKYGKVYVMSKRYHVHDPARAAKIGDVVAFEACRPLSRLKRWRYLSTLRQAAAKTV